MWRCVLFDLGDTLIDNHPMTPAERDDLIAKEFEVWLRRRSMRTADEFSPDERAQVAEIDASPLVQAVNEALIEAAVKYWATGREAPPGEVFARLQGEVAAAAGLVASHAELEENYVRWRMSRQRVLPDAPELLAALRAAGIKCGLVSNTAFSRESMDAYLRVRGLADYLDAVVYSSEIGWRKPKPQIFRAVLAKLEVSAAETAFVGDDVVADVEGAIGAGIAAIWMWGNHPVAGDAPEVIRHADDGTELPGVWPDPAHGDAVAALAAQAAELTRSGRLLGAARTLEQTGKLLLKS